MNFFSLSPFPPLATGLSAAAKGPRVYSMVKTINGFIRAGVGGPGAGTALGCPVRGPTCCPGPRGAGPGGGGMHRLSFEHIFGGLWRKLSWLAGQQQQINRAINSPRRGVGPLTLPSPQSPEPGQPPHCSSPAHEVSAVSKIHPLSSPLHLWLGCLRVGLLGFTLNTHKAL